MAATIMVNQPKHLTSKPATSLLAVQKIPKATTAKIEDDQGRLVAHGALIRYTTNQAYFVLQHIDPDLHKKAITVFTPDESQPFNIRVKKVLEKHINRNFLPMYIQVHFNPEERLPIEHMVDLLAEKTLGNNNLELRKNVTVDLFDSDGDPFIRDNAGFIVTDRMRFEQVTVVAKEALGVLKGSGSGVRVVEIPNGGKLEDILEFDGVLSNHQRSEFVQYLCSKNRVVVARKSREGEKSCESETVGYAVIAPLGAQFTLQILCLYASDQQTAESIVEFVLKTVQGAQSIVFCTSCSQWEKLRSLASYKKRPIYRRHTRAVPVNIKWEQIFAMNVGMNLF